MTVLMENTAVYRGGTLVDRPRNCTARLYADRVEIRAADGEAPPVTLPLASISSAKASGPALLLKGDSFKGASIEFMSTGRKILLGVLGGGPVADRDVCRQGKKDGDRVKGQDRTASWVAASSVSGGRGRGRRIPPGVT